MNEYKFGENSGQITALAALGPQDTLDCGWIAPHKRTPQQATEHGLAMMAVPEFELFNAQADTANVTKSVLWDFTKKANGGKHFQTFRQITGSCVGQGLGQALWRLASVEVVRLGDPELIKLPFFLLPYGRSRYYLGERGRGDGSTGATAARAAVEDGIVAADEPGLPPWTDDDGITFGRDAEYKWSDGAAISAEWLGKAKKHLVKSAAQIKSVDEMRTALQNGYPCTIASDWGGMMQPPATGTPAVLLNRRVTTWNHQMSVHGWWDHPTLGEIFYILNSWGPRAHGTPADDSQPGGFWVKSSEMAYIINQREAFAFSQFAGFEAQLNFSAYASAL